MTLLLVEELFLRNREKFRVTRTTKNATNICSFEWGVNQRPPGVLILGCRGTLSLLKSIDLEINDVLRLGTGSKILAYRLNLYKRHNRTIFVRKLFFSEMIDPEVDGILRLRHRTPGNGSGINGNTR